MDPTESIKNLTFSLSVLDAAPVLKADALTKNESKKKKGRQGQGGAARGREHCEKCIYNTKTILIYIFGWADSKTGRFFLYKILEYEKGVVRVRTEALLCVTRSPSHSITCLQ